MSLLRELWRQAFSPTEAFRRRALEGPALWPSVRTLLLLRVPLAFASTVLGYWYFRQSWLGLLEPKGGLFEGLQGLALPLNPEEWRELVAELPRLPEVGRALPWLVLAAPLGVLSLWLHDAVWDHGCLWMLGGVKRRTFRPTLIAEAEALSVGSLGAAAGLLAYLPYVGWLLALPLAAIGIWFWILRGFALAAWHGCPPWKGVLATLLHALLAACCLAGLVGLCGVVLCGVLA